MIIDSAAYAAMIEHLQQAAPHEGCGLLAGLRRSPCPRDTDGDGTCGARSCPDCGQPLVVDTWTPMANHAEFPRLRFQMDEVEQVATWNALADSGRRPLVVVHSHPTGSAVPSPHDVRYAVDPTLLHMVVALEGREPVAWLWQIRTTGRMVGGHEQLLRVPYTVADLGFQPISPTDLTRGVSGA
jgi:proteasome lid subunit RPN8/RPN11